MRNCVIDEHGAFVFCERDITFARNTSVEGKNWTLFFSIDLNELATWGRLIHDRSVSSLTITEIVLSIATVHVLENQEEGRSANPQTRDTSRRSGLSRLKIWEILGNRIEIC